MAIVELVLRGHLTSSSLAEAFAGIAPQMTAAGDEVGLLVDCLAMTGYDLDARSGFVAWNREHKRVLKKVAIATDNRLWHMVVSAMSLAAGMPMKAFDTAADARAWLAS